MEQSFEEHVGDADQVVVLLGLVERIYSLLGWFLRGFGSLEGCLKVMNLLRQSSRNREIAINCETRTSRAELGAQVSLASDLAFQNFSRIKRVLRRLQTRRSNIRVTR